MSCNVGVFGASGRMGDRVCALLQSEYPDRAHLAHQWNTRSNDLTALQSVDVIIDFSLLAGTRQLVSRLIELPPPRPVLVCGTTGLTGEDLDKFQSLGEQGVAMQANNFSVGVAAVIAMLENISPMLQAFGYEPVLTETHHTHKQDQPSGTALTMRAALETQWKNVDTHSIRAGEVIGRHVVEFHGPADCITVEHSAMDRGLFARGAIDAGIWLAESGIDYGFFTMASYMKRRYFS